MSRPLAVLVGSIGKLPLAGFSFACLHYIVGLQELGYEVHYIERVNKPDDCLDPEAGRMTDDPSYGIRYLENVLTQFGIGRDRYSFIDRQNGCHGSGWPALRDALKHAAFLLTVANPTWFEELERCTRRAYVDVDPLFTQVAMAAGQGSRAGPPSHYPTLFTYCTRMGGDGCTVPAAGRKWIPTRPVVVTKLWNPTPVVGPLPVTALMSWASGSDVTYEGRVYGHKNREVVRFMDLPQRTAHRLVLAVGTRGVPREQLRESGWQIVNSKDVTRTMDGYRAFIAGSRADLGIAKHAYVASRCGWFSDRSTCFLASGRPVLHQDTGFGDWLPTGEGVLVFSDVEDVLDGLRRLDADYDRHAKAARAIAEEHFEAAKVIGRMLDDAGFR